MENFLDRLNQIALQLTEWVWGIPLIVLLLAVGILLSVRMHFLQLRQLPRALKFMVQNEEGGSGEVSSFGALCTALSATIGTGNIVGVATAISLGGPGALFWMWVAAFFGMATKYAEGLLAVKYRTVDADGHVLGGAFYYIERGIAERFPKWKGSARVLAVLFAVFGAGAGLLGIGTITQVNGIASAIQNLTDPEKAGMVVLFGHSFGFTWTTLIVAVVTALLAACFVFFAFTTILGCPGMPSLSLMMWIMPLTTRITFLQDPYRWRIF
ncbi:MAG: alanine:cation symporter family protein [Acutalibacteraceae bacterium]|jgi:AGCS family alanine or glycine:cation symporter